MRTYVLTHLSDAALLRGLDALVGQERTATAEVLAHIAEVDSRRLYLPEGFPSMYAYCVEKLHLSEQAAMKRIRAARSARRFPAIFHAVAEERLHLSAVVLLSPNLTPGNAAELVAAATWQTKEKIERLLAERFPRPDVPARIEPIAASPVPTSAEQLSPGTVGKDSTERVSAGAIQLAPAQVAAPVVRPTVKPIAPERFALQFTIGKGTHDKLRHVQALLSHQHPSGDLAEVFDRALDALQVQLEKRKFAATGRPRPRTRRSSNPRHVPAHVKRAVWERDRGQCTFVSEQGHRCSSRKLLEFDHVDPVARGGQATVEGMRLRCRAHNQYEAEQTFGAGFMSAKREKARVRAEAARRAQVVARAQDEPRGADSTSSHPTTLPDRL